MSTTINFFTAPLTVCRSGWLYAGGGLDGLLLLLVLGPGEGSSDGDEPGALLVVLHLEGVRGPDSRDLKEVVLPLRKAHLHINVYFASLLNLFDNELFKEANLFCE